MVAGGDENPCNDVERRGHLNRAAQRSRVPQDSLRVVAHDVRNPRLGEVRERLNADGSPKLMRCRASQSLNPGGVTPRGAFFFQKGDEWTDTYPLGSCRGTSRNGRHGQGISMPRCTGTKLEAPMPILTSTL